MKKILFLVLLLSLMVDLSANEISYTLKFSAPSRHELEIEINLNTNDNHELLFAMPAWAPGRYVIYNFSKNVFDVMATDSNNRPLPVEIVDKQTWRVSCEKHTNIQFKYKVFAHTFDGTFSKIDAQGASLNGAGIFMYIHNRKDWPVKLKIQKPEHWDCLSPLEQNSEGIYGADSYDHLIDCPLELGELFIHEFEHRGKKHQMVIQQRIDPVFLRYFSADIKKFIEKQAEIFGQDLPYETYVFFFTLNKDLIHTDGMEHRNSCRVIQRIDPNQIKADANTDNDYDNLIWLSAHEFFHLWNVKRLRPTGLEPFDYEREVYSDCLWIVEGFTSYYAYLSLIRSGIYTPEKLYSEFAKQIDRYENAPGKTRRTLREVCLLTWLFKGNIPQYENTNIEQTTYSYYYKGLLVAMLLDLKIRQLTSNRVTLDDVMRKMYEQFYLHGNESHPRKVQGYTAADFESMVQTMAGGNWTEFFDKAVRGREELDYELLKVAGLELSRSQQSDQFEIKLLDKMTQEQREILQSWIGP